MSESTARLITGLAISFPLAIGLVFLTWSMQSTSEFAYITSIGVGYALFILSLMGFITIKKLIQSEGIDYTQRKFDIIFSTLKYLDGNKPVYPNENSKIDLSDLEFDYVPTYQKNQINNNQLNL